MDLTDQRAYKEQLDEARKTLSRYESENQELQQEVDRLREGRPGLHLGSPTSHAYSSHSSDQLARSEFHDLRSNQLIAEDNNFNTLAVSQRQDDMEPVREGELRRNRNLINTEIGMSRPTKGLIDMTSNDSGNMKIEIATSDFADEDIIERQDKWRESDSNSVADGSQRNSQYGRAPLSTRSLRGRANLGYTTSKNAGRSSFTFDLEDQDKKGERGNGKADLLAK